MAAPQVMESQTPQDTHRVSCYPANQPQQYPGFYPSDCNSLVDAFQARYNQEILGAHRTWFANNSLPYFYEQKPACVASVRAATPMSADTFSVADILEAIQTVVNDLACRQPADAGVETMLNGGTASLKRSSGELSPTFWITLSYALKNPDGTPMPLTQPSSLLPEGDGTLPAIVP